jgi:hypothetical protein
VSDPYGLTGEIQPVNPAWGAEGFDPSVPGFSSYCSWSIGYISRSIPS